MAEHPNLVVRARGIVAQAWAGMLAILLTMLVADLVRLSIRAPYSELAESLAGDPGLGGLWVLVCLICFNALLQVAVRTFEGRGFVLLVFWLSVGYTLFFLFHQLVHVWSGERFSMHTILDFTHHALGIWACWAAWRWSKLAVRQR
jgi:hypothetical protein